MLIYSSLYNRRTFLLVCNTVDIPYSTTMLYASIASQVESFLSVCRAELLSALAVQIANEKLEEEMDTDPY